MNETRFAVMNVIKNDERIVKLFGADEKEAAKAYATALAQQPHDGVVVCGRVTVRDGERVPGTGVAVFGVW